MPYTVSPLIGRIHTSSTGNVARIEPLGKDGVIAKWRTKPSPIDVAELETWAAAVLNVSIEVTNHFAGTLTEGARRKGEAAYQLWKKEQ